MTTRTTRTTRTTIQREKALADAFWSPPGGEGPAHWRSQEAKDYAEYLRAERNLPRRDGKPDRLFSDWTGQRAELREEIDRQIAKERGWIVARADFTIRELRESGMGARKFRRARDVPTSRRGPAIVDHHSCFRSRLRRYKPMAILSHTYERDAGAIIAWAESANLNWEFLEWSWYFPGRCYAVLFKTRFRKAASD